MANRKYASKIMGAYLVFGILWILLSDTFVGSLGLDIKTVVLIGVIKGWVYVVLSALLIYLLSDRYIGKIAQVNESLQDSYEKLAATHQQLAGTKEELQQNFSKLQQSYEQIHSQNMMLSSVQETAQGLLNQLNLDVLLYKILQSATKMGKTPHALLNLFDEQTTTFSRKAGLGMFADKVDELELEVGAQSRLVYESGQTSILPDYSRWEKRTPDGYLDVVRASIQVPLKINKNIVGTLGLFYTDPARRICDEDAQMLERFGALAAMAIQNAKLHMQLQEELEEHTRKEESIRAIFNAANDAIFVCEADSLELLSCNYKAEAMLGHSLAEMQHLGIKEIDARYYGGKLLPAVAGLQAGERSSLVEIAGVNRQGESLVLESNHNKVMLGGRLCLIAALRDISARKRAEAELDRTQQYKLALLRSLPDLMVRFDASGCFIDYNQPDNFELYMPPEAFLGKHITEVFPVDISQKVLQCIGQLLEGGAPSRVLKIDYRLVQNETALDFEARFVKCGAGEVLAIIRDITQQKQTMQQLEFLGLYDRLTEVYNRNYFEERAMTISSKGAGIVVCDLDGLKLINDTMGHKAGDELLQAVARILQACVSEPDIVARIGGDEFAILVFEPTPDKMRDMAAAIKQGVEDSNAEHLRPPLSLSVGWAADYGTVVDMDALFKQADNNMYRVKMHQRMSSHSAIVEAMMQALEARDYITEGHADRLQHWVAALAEKLNFSEPMIADLNLFAKFHDIGKVGIPDYILFKQGALTEEEYTAMQRHPEIGFRIAKSATDLAPIADWILKHHERWDGRGYPLGIEGEKIPLASRMLALADSFDAMTNDRPYHKAMDIDAALAEIRRCSGQQFDPELVEPFIEIVSACRADALATKI